MLISKVYFFNFAEPGLASPVDMSPDKASGFCKVFF